MSDFIPDGWGIEKLSDICNIVGGGTPERTKIEYWGGDIPWLSPTEVTKLKGRYIHQSKEKITSLGLNKSSAKLNPVGTVLMTSRASIGYVAINTIPVTTNQGFQSLQCKGSVYNEYLYQHITWIRPELEKMSAGSTFSEISSSTLKGIKLVFPPLPEQQKIASILTSVDEVIEKTQAQIDKLKDLKTGMMQTLLTKGVGIDGKPHTEFKDSPVGRIPKGWEVVDLDEVTKVIDCKHATPKYFNEGYPVVKPGNIKEGNLNVSGCAFTDKSGFDNLNENHKPRVGDIIYSRNQTYGIGAYVNKEIQFCIGQDVCIISPINCVSQYIYFTVNAPVVREQVELLAAGSTFKRINLGAIRKLKVPMPPFEEQEKIASVLASIDAKVAIVKIKLVQLVNTKKALMQDLLTGKVRVNVASETSGH